MKEKKKKKTTTAKYKAKVCLRKSHKIFITLYFILFFNQATHDF